MPDRASGSPPGLCRAGRDAVEQSRLSASGPLHTRRAHCGTPINGQTIYVTEGVGLAQCRGGPIIIRAGDRVFFEPGEEHWHGAAPSIAAHLAMLQVDDEGNSASWGDQVTEEEYNAGVLTRGVSGAGERPFTQSIAPTSPNAYHLAHQGRRRRPRHLNLRERMPTVPVDGATWAAVPVPPTRP